MRESRPARRHEVCSSSARFNTVNGVAKRKFASLNPTNGADGRWLHRAPATLPDTELEATNTTVYLGGKFTRINSTVHRGLAAVNATTGALVVARPATRGTGQQHHRRHRRRTALLNVQELLLTPDSVKLIVVHTGRQIAGQDRYGVGLINTLTNTCCSPWRTQLWEDNLRFVGDIQRAYGGAVAPNGQYFVVTSGSGGDRPPINDTAVAFPIEGGEDVQTRCGSPVLFDSVYSVAITEVGVYLGGHFTWMESPTAKDPWPGLDNVGLRHVARASRATASATTSSSATTSV